MLHEVDPAIAAQRPLNTQPKIQPAALEWLLISCVHDLQFFAEVRQLIAPHHFHPYEAPLRIAFEAMCISVDSYSGITFDTLRTITDSLISQNQSIVLTDVQKNLIFRNDEEGLLYQLTNPVGIVFDSVNQRLARDLLRRFAHERTVVDPLRHVMNPGFNQGVPSNLEGFLDKINKQTARLTTLQQVPEVDIAPAIGTQLQQSNIFQQTGISWIDNALGGQREGDCNGLIGPTGGGKTTLAIHMAAAAAKQCWTDAQTTGEKPRLVVFFSAEEAGVKLRPRLWSVFFQIARDKLERLNDWSTLTTQDRLDQYEIDMQKEQPYKLSETERYMMYSPQLQQCLKIVDVSGSEEFPNAGNGFIPELVSYLSRYDQPIHSVFIDYAGILCERYMNASGKTDPFYYRQLLKGFGDQCRKQISEAFKCTTWVLHQAKGDAGNTSPTRLMHHTDAGESKDFAVNMAVCGCLGVEDPTSGCRRFDFSKVRYKSHEDVPPLVLRINDRFAKMEDVTSQYVIDKAKRRFLKANEANAINGLGAVLPQAGPAGLARDDNPAFSVEV